MGTSRSEQPSGPIPSDARPADALGPSPEETAAIVVAVELLWPRPEPPAAPVSRSSEAWRWSGRWWGPLHVVADRRRPW
jgi:hypothetical protein